MKKGDLPVSDDEYFDLLVKTMEEMWEKIEPAELSQVEQAVLLTVNRVIYVDETFRLFFTHIITFYFTCKALGDADSAITVANWTKKYCDLANEMYGEEIIQKTMSKIKEDRKGE